MQRSRHAALCLCGLRLRAACCASACCASACCASACCASACCAGRAARLHGCTPAHRQGTRIERREPPPLCVCCLRTAGGRTERRGFWCRQQAGSAWRAMHRRPGAGMQQPASASRQPAGTHPLKAGKAGTHATPRAGGVEILHTRHSQQRPGAPRKTGVGTHAARTGAP
jgi:hypothetical protein